MSLMLNLILSAIEVVPGVLNCRRRSCKLPEHGLDPRIARYITEAGFEGLFKVPNLEVDHALITALVERWRPETHTFHLPHGEMSITLQDIEVMLGVPVDGLPITGAVKMDWPTLCLELLGHRPPDPIPHPHENTSILAGARLRFTWLDALFSDRVSVLPLQFLNPISNAKRYSWGSGALAWLYRHLCKASESKAKQIGGAVMLVQLWAYSRFPLICPVMRLPLPPVEAGPLANRYVI
uniref:Aminotransferase-like plant mobile domain-containing protein n=1 Tax=Quercus lobata TaxID=97700 RepID=A0A7N2QZ36_QUELO